MQTRTHTLALGARPSLELAEAGGQPHSQGGARNSGQPCSRAREGRHSRGTAQGTTARTHPHEGPCLPLAWRREGLAGFL